MDLRKLTVERLPSIDPEIRERLLEPFIVAMNTVLTEMAGSEAVTDEVCATAHPLFLGDISGQLRLPEIGGTLVMSFPHDTALALARHVLADNPDAADEAMIQDCVGEIGNVVAGQAKALLAGTPYHFTFTPPLIAAGDQRKIPQGANLHCLVVTFRSGLGDFALQLFLAGSSLS